MQTSAQDWAVELAGRGFSVFPIRPGSKEPWVGPGESWLEVMTTDPNAIAEWFQSRPAMNYGVCPNAQYVIIDLDVRKVDGPSALRALEVEQDPTEYVFGQTFTVQTPSGGKHLYFEVPSEVGNAHQFPKGIDIRGGHGYVVGPGCALQEGPYEVESDPGIIPAPDWITSRLKRAVQKLENREALFDLDTAEARAQAMDFLRLREPAIEGIGGGYHTVMTAMALNDFGLSAAGAVEAMTEPYLLEGESEPLCWNDRCLPPWDVYGTRNTLEEKANNAWKYRTREPGSKSGSLVFADEDMEGAVDPDTIADTTFSRLRQHLFKAGQVFNRGKRREYIIPEWLPGYGLVALLGKRGGGKSVVMLDLALHIASDMEWCGYPVKQNLHAIYLAGEDDEGAEEQVRAWCVKHGVEHPPLRFWFLDIITDLLDAGDTKEWAEFLHKELGPDGRAVVFMDTWQRASSRGGQNKDEDMQKAVHHAEALARSLRGPAVVAFHPPKHDDQVVMGSSVIENATTAIWRLSDNSVGKKIEVTRIKGKGIGNYHLFKFEEIDLGEKDEFDRARTGVVPIKIGGVEGGIAEDAARADAKKAFALVMRTIEARRKTDDPESAKHYTISAIAKKIGLDMANDADKGDPDAIKAMDLLAEHGNVNPRSWQRVGERINELFDDDPRGYDFGDGCVLYVYKDRSLKRIRLDTGAGLTLDSDGN